MNRIFKNRNVFFLVVILVSSTLLITSISLSLIYNKAVLSLENTLSDIVMREKTYIKVLYDLKFDDEEIVSILVNVKKVMPGIGKSGDFTISKYQGGVIQHLISERNKSLQLQHSESIKTNVPLMRALNGETGVFKGLDSRGIKVYSAFTYVPELKWGIVAKISVAEFNQSYIQAGVFAFILALVLISFCIYLFLRITDPVIKSITDNEAKLSLLFNNSADAIMIHDFKGQILEVNETICKRLQFDRAELIKLKLDNLDSIPYAEKISERMNALLSQGEAFFETEHVAKNKQIIPTEINARIIDYFGKTAILSVARDISKRKEMEKSLLESEEKFRTLIEVSIDAILLNEKNVFTFANKAALKLFGTHNPHDLLGKTPYELFHPDFHEIIETRIKEMVISGTAVSLMEGKIIRIDGQEVNVEVAATPFLFKGERSILVVLRDITERKDAEAEIQMSHFILKQQNEEFLTLNEELNVSNKQIQKINEDLLVSKQKAEESDRLKTAFLQNISHEIRTPLNAIMGFSELMHENYDDSEKLEKYTGIILNRSSDLLEIINEILDIAKIESGQLPLNEEDCNINQLFQDLNVFFSEQKKLQVKKHIKLLFIPATVSIKADTLKLKQIFVNLIGNAFKFTDEGLIEVGCQSYDGENIIFYVKDTGIGIPKEKQELIFERFMQINPDSSKLYGGTGLGLPIVKGLLELMKGKVWLTSKEKEGTIFYFSFPARQLYKDGSFVKVKTNFLELNKSNGTILIVEDDEFNAEYLNEILKHSGMKLIHCKYGKDAIEIALNRSVDLILMDIRLPDMEGYEVTRQIKVSKPSIKIIAQTAYAAASDEEKALHAGCDDYISKPIKKELLLSKIKFNISGDICLQS